MIIPEISPTAGINGDGVLLGSVLQSLFTGTFNNAQTADTTYAYRKDLASGSASFVDISAAVVSGTADAVEPFGQTATFTAGDALYIACAHDVKELFVQVTTPGVWAGTGLEVLDSTDGKTANRTLANVTDASNGFRNAAGTYRITWDQPATPRVVFSPVPGDITERKWLVIRPSGLTGVTTAPKLSRVWLIHTVDSPVYSDRTTVHNAALTDASFGTVPQFFPVVDSAFEMVLPFLAYGIDMTVHRRIGTNSVTRTPEYLASDDTWKPLQGFVDGSNYWQNGPVNLGDPTQAFTVRWTVPTDWAPKARTYTKADNTTVTATGYVVRYRVTAVSPYGPVTPPLFRSRVRAFGNANVTGVEARSATTFRGLSLVDAAIANTAICNCQLANLSTGASAAFSIPANPVFPVNVDTTDLSIAAGERWGIICTSGGTLRNAQIEFAS